MPDYEINEGYVEAGRRRADSPLDAPRSLDVGEPVESVAQAAGGNADRAPHEASRHRALLRRRHGDAATRRAIDGAPTQVGAAGLPVWMASASAEHARTCAPAVCGPRATAAATATATSDL